MFAIYLDPELKSSKSFISFGGLPSGYNTKDMNCHTIEGTYHWELKFKGLQYKGKNIDMGKVTRAFMDTGSTLTLFPKKVYHDLLDQLCENFDC